MSVAQLVPEYPTLQVQVYALLPCEQAALFVHGVDAHSSKSVAQFVPLNPAEQVQM
jgi:hypothetical protein